jgi:hypothetical protein
MLKNKYYFKMPFFLRIFLTNEAARRKKVFETSAKKKLTACSKLCQEKDWTKFTDWWWH